MQSQHTKLSTLFRKIHKSFIDELNAVTGCEHKVIDSFDVFSKSIDTQKLVEKKATSLNVKDFLSLEILPGLQVETFADTISTIELVRTFFLYVLILAVIVEKIKDECNEDDDTFIVALQTARKGNAYNFKGGSPDVIKLLDSIVALNKLAPTDDKPIDMSFLENSMIGKIAKEISEEIDISGIKKPEDVLNFADPKNNVIGDIVNKVGSKIHSKLSNGELKQDELLSEAFGLLNSFGGKIPGGGNISDILNNPMMKNMMSSMAGQFGGGAPSKGTKMGVNTSKLRQMSARERLRTKLNKSSRGEDAPATAS